MNVIDHAILIPASPEFIWRFLGDITQNANWQEDCINISFLTTQHEGKGARWRYSTSKGKDVIVEISAWYDTLGYEYTVVEGSSVSTNQGRIRLQEIAEGTLVQWTFNYEVDGMLSGLRNSIGLKRSLTNHIQDSLRNLYKLVQQETGGISTHEAKASLREAPDVEERSTYQPRHPSSISEDREADTYPESEYPSEQSIQYAINDTITEPPVADDDTKPNPVVQGTEEIEVIESTSLASLLSVNEPPVADDDTKPNEPIEESPAVQPDEIEDFTETEMATTSPKLEPIIEPKVDIRDTSRISVFDVFGLQKPSEKQDMKAITDADLIASKKSASNESVEIPRPEAIETVDEEENIETEAQVKIEESIPEDEKIEIEVSEVQEDTTEDIEEEAVVVSEQVPEAEDDIEEKVINDTSPETTKNESSIKIMGLRLKARKNSIYLRRHN